MPRLISKNSIQKIKSLRKKGWSIPEIRKELKVGYGSIFRYIQGVKILPEYKNIWLGKRGGSTKRKKFAEVNARKKAEKLISKLSKKEKIIFFTALYWGEGSKGDFGLSNTDPEFITVFIKGLRSLFNIPKKDLRVSVRIYEDLDKNKCIQFWSKITGVPINSFVSVNILKGKKKGKLPYGMCRVRVKKGGDLLKYVTAIKRQIIEMF